MSSSANAATTSSHPSAAVRKRSRISANVRRLRGVLKHPSRELCAESQTNGILVRRQQQQQPSRKSVPTDYLGQLRQLVSRSRFNPYYATHSAPAPKAVRFNADVMMHVLVGRQTITKKVPLKTGNSMVVSAKLQ